MRKLKVLHICNDFNEFNGLIETFLILAKTTSYDRFDLNVCVFSYADSEFGREFEAAGGKLFSLEEPYGSLNIPRGFLKLCRFIWRFKPDIVQTYCIKSNVIGILAAVVARVPVICGTELTLRDIRPPGIRSLRRLLTYPLLAVAMKSCDRLIFNSHATQSAWVGDRTNTRFVVMYPPFDLDKYTRAVNAQNVERSAGPRIGFVGRLSEQKGVSVLLKAMTSVKDRIPDARLLVVGTGEMEDELKVLTKEADLEGCVDFLGFKRNVFEHMRQMDVLVLPSRTEGFGMAALEAMAMGVPVVATPIGGLQEIIVGGETGLFVPYGDSESLAEAVVELLRDTDRRRQMGRNGQRRAFSAFHPSRYTGQLEELYEELYTEKILPRPRPSEAGSPLRRGSL